jgi:hypothetical protein
MATVIASEGGAAPCCDDEASECVAPHKNAATRAEVRKEDFIADANVPLFFGRIVWAMPKQGAPTAGKTVHVTEGRATLELGTDDKSSFVRIQEFCLPGLTTWFSARHLGEHPVDGKGAAIGTAAGGQAGALGAYLTGNHEIVLPSETLLASRFFCQPVRTCMPSHAIVHSGALCRE